MYSDELVCSNESSRVEITSRGDDACTETQGAVEEVEPRGGKKRVGREHSRIEETGVRAAMEDYGRQWGGEQRKKCDRKAETTRKGRKQKKHKEGKNKKKATRWKGNEHAPACLCARTSEEKSAQEGWERVRVC